MAKFPTWFPDYDCPSPALLDVFVSSNPSICSTVTFSSMGNSDHVAVSVFIDFVSISKQDVPYYSTAYDYSRANWDGLFDGLFREMFHGKIYINVVLVLLVLNFVSGSRLELMYISLIVRIR